jgi:hypothetical protein
MKILVARTVGRLLLVQAGISLTHASTPSHLERGMGETEVSEILVGFLGTGRESLRVE